MNYAFAPGVFACLADGRLVILNVPADRYLMLPAETEASLLRLIENTPGKPGDREIHERLCTNGLVLQPSCRPRLELCQATAPLCSLIDDGWPPPGACPVAIAGLSAIKAAMRLKVGGLDKTLRGVIAVRPPLQDSINQATGAAVAFAELRMTVRALDRCLPLSLALASAAKRRHGEVRLVLGVRCHPFCAHAWVQLGPKVLNDRLDTVHSFTPILVL